MITRNSILLIATFFFASLTGASYAAQFWQGYCDTEKKTLGGWSNQKKVARQNAEFHKRNNPNHSVSVNSK